MAFTSDTIEGAVVLSSPHLPDSRTDSTFSEVVELSAHVPLAQNDQSFGESTGYVATGFAWNWQREGYDDFIVSPDAGMFAVSGDELTLVISIADLSGQILSTDILALESGDVINLAWSGELAMFNLDAAPTAEGSYVVVTGAFYGAVPDVGDIVAFLLSAVVQADSDDEPVEDEDEDDAFYPDEHTVAEVKAYIDSLECTDDEMNAEIQRVLAEELNGQNRPTLIEWLNTKQAAV